MYNSFLTTSGNKEFGPKDRVRDERMKAHVNRTIDLERNS
jgi:hypothetical protein